MAREDQIWLSTGQAAKFCAVTPATVLNWLRTGRLTGVRTPGGHFRIHRDQLAPLLARGRPDNLDLTSSRAEAPLRCWEYLSESGQVRKECETCVVFQVRSAWCFHIAALGLDTGHARRFCPTSCDDCAYYRRVMGLPTNVLVVTADAELIQTLEDQSDEAISLRFARNAYEASAAVEEFLPAFAIVDLETPGAGDNGLLESLATDPRLPGLKTVVAREPNRGKNRRDASDMPYIAGSLKKPFDLTHIQAVIDGFPVEMLKPGSDEAQAGP